MDIEEASSRERKVAKESDCIARNFGALAGMAISGPSAAVFLIGWPHEALGNEISCYLYARVAEGMHEIKYLTAERRRDLWSWFYFGCVAVECDGGDWDVNFLQLQCGGYRQESGELLVLVLSCCQSLGC